MQTNTINKIRGQIRKLGYQLAVREIYGENTQSYHDLKWDHRRLLAKLYTLEKRMP